MDPEKTIKTVPQKLSTLWLARLGFIMVGTGMLQYALAFGNESTRGGAVLQCLAGGGLLLVSRRLRFIAYAVFAILGVEETKNSVMRMVQAQDYSWAGSLVHLVLGALALGLCVRGLFFSRPSPEPKQDVKADVAPSARPEPIPSGPTPANFGREHAPPKVEVKGLGAAVVHGVLVGVFLLIWGLLKVFADAQRGRWDDVGAILAWIAAGVVGLFLAWAAAQRRVPDVAVSSPESWRASKQQRLASDPFGITRSESKPMTTEQLELWGVRAVVILALVVAVAKRGWEAVSQEMYQGMGDAFKELHVNDAFVVYIAGAMLGGVFLFLSRNKVRVFQVGSAQEGVKLLLSGGMAVAGIFGLFLGVAGLQFLLPGAAVTLDKGWPLAVFGAGLALFAYAGIAKVNGFDQKKS